ncbi:MAG: PEP-CTERM sorting domain-containing protein [Fimbriimonadaceae bacterium]|nr:PEP-CTERM sorting domain-containing protein [Fimbriimonadaceae bacterium]
MKYGLRELALAATMLTAATAGAQWVQGGNGHWFQVVLIAGTDHSWSAARAEAQAMTGPQGQAVDLATLTSEAENAFAFGLADNPIYWAIDASNNNQGPYLGAYQPPGSSEPAGGWTWVTGEPWSFTQWAGNEPNNNGGDESVLQFFANGTGRAATWNDMTDAPGGPQLAFVAEAVPEPASIAALTLGLGVLVGRRLRRR